MSRGRRVLIGLGATVGVLVFVVVLLFLIALKPYRAPSESMAPTIDVNDRFVINRLLDPGVGDIAVFHPPAGAVGEGAKCRDEVAETELCARPVGERSEVTFVKRVVAGPGDRLSIRGGRVVLNGRRVDEPYTRECEGGFGCDFPGEITIPEGHWFMLGDNRGMSDDSRFWGPVPEDWIIGRAFLRYWPVDAIGGL